MDNRVILGVVVLQRTFGYEKIEAIVVSSFKFYAYSMPFSMILVAASRGLTLQTVFRIQNTFYCL